MRFSQDWHACFKINEGRNITLINNVAAGSERLGFHTNGQNCDTDNKWTGLYSFVVNFTFV